MSLSVVESPDGLQAVGDGQLLYRFSEDDLSGKTNYRVVISLNGLDLPDFEFRPDADGVITADIAPILRAALTLGADPADRFKSTYVTYQAVWNESSDSAVGLSSNVIYFWVAVQNPNILTTPTSPLKVIVYDGRPKWFEFALGGLAADSGFMIRGVGSNPDLLFPFDGSQFALNQFEHSTWPENTTTTILSFDSDIPFGDSDDDYIEVYPESPDLEDGFAQRFTATATGGSVIILKVKRVGSPTFDVKFTLVGVSGGEPNPADVKFTITHDLSNVSATGNYVYIDLGITPIVNATDYALLIEPVGEGNEINYYQFMMEIDGSFTEECISIFDGASWNDDTGKALVGKFLYTPTELIELLHEITVVEPCENPVYLRWIGDNGTIETWLFSGNHVVTLDPQTNAKYLYKTLYAEGINLLEFQTISQLFREGQIYNDTRRIGQFVQDITNGVGSAIDVIPTPQATSFPRWNKKTTLSVEIRYPGSSNRDIT